MPPIHALLVANRGEIADRVLRTCEHLGIRGLAVYTRADQHLPYLDRAHAAACIGDGPVGSSYLDIARVLAAARTLGADAIHPGYGLLSENPDFAQAVIDAGLRWVGPPPAAMRALADKAAARTVAQEHRVPVLPGAHLPDPSPQAIAQAAEQIGFPLLIKAVAGGGGRGMRRVDDPAELAQALASAQREAGSAFGDERVLLERFVERARHIEVQIFGDAHGNVVHLGERECSVQRRYQKIVEESPSPAVSPELRQELGTAACTIARAVDYQGAGTVEFILEPDGRFWFLEVNARLQVEHPVTELVTGLDLVAWQIAIAEGEPLPLRQDQVALSGHAIEVRLYAEDPMRDNLPGTGELVALELPQGPGVRVDAGFATGTTISPFYDSLIAKVLASGPTRTIATRRLQRALEQTWAPGPVNNLPLLKQILASPAWARAELHTNFLAHNDLPRAPPLHLVHGVLAATVAGWVARGPSPSTGFRLRGPAEQVDRYTSFGDQVTARWRALAPDTLHVRIEHGEHRSDHTVLLHHHSDRHLTVEVDGVRHRWRVVTASGGAPVDGSILYAKLGGGDEAMVRLEPRVPAPSPATPPPGSLTAPTPGTVVAVHAARGQAVSQGQTLLIIEAMKMEHPVRADRDGVVELLRAETGQSVSEGELLVRLADDDASPNEAMPAEQGSIQRQE